MVIKVQDIAAYVKNIFGDEAAVQITDNDILRWTNAAQRELASRNDILRGTATATVTSGVSEYDISGLNIQKIHSIYVNGRPVDNRSFQHAEEYIIGNDPDRTRKGQPIMWYKWGNTINFWPAPDNTVVDGIKIYYIAAPAVIETVNGVLEIPDEYYNRVVEYVMSQAYELDENAEASMVKLQQFSDGLSRMAGVHDRPEFETYPTITILPEDAY